MPPPRNLPTTEELLRELRTGILAVAHNRVEHIDRGGGYIGVRLPETEFQFLPSVRSRDMQHGDICPVCKHAYDGNAEGCSEFCATQDDATLAAFANLKDGEWGLWPCAECGCTIDDMYTPGGICSDCVKPRAARIRGELLRQCLAYVPKELAEKIEMELDGKTPLVPDQKPRYERDEPV